MGRPPSNGGPTFRFNQAEVTEMEAILQAHHTAMPEREVLMALADKFSSAPERSGKIKVHMKQVWNWFQNRRYAIRAKAAKAPGKLLVSSMPRDNSPILTSTPRDNSALLRNGPQVPPQPLSNPTAPVGTMPVAPQHPPASSGKSASENSQMEFEAKSARDGAWYDVSTFLSHRSLETGDPEVLVRFSGFGPEEDEWVNIRKHVRQRSLPCESSECVAVLPGDLILCFQEGKEQALYYDAHVLDAQRRRHDVRGCRCRFLVRYDHDQSEEIVALRKICRRPETDYRLQQLHALNESASVNQNKTSPNIHMGSTLRVYPPPAAEVTQKPQKVEASAAAPLQPSLPEITQKPQKVVEASVTAPPQPSLPVSVSTETNKLQHKVELVVLPPKINLPQVSQGPVVSAPAHSSFPEVSEGKPQQKVVVGPASIGNLPEVSEAKGQEKVDSIVPAPSHSNLPEVSEPKTQEKVEPVVPAPSHSNLPEEVEPMVPAAPSQSNPPDVLEKTAQQKVEHVDVGPMLTPTDVPEAGGEGNVGQKVEALLPEPSSTNVAKVTDNEGQNKIEAVIAPAPGNVAEVMEVTVEPQDVEMVNADKESSSVVPSGTTTVSDQDQEMQEAS